jgi:nicotinamide mononucleotide transporter
MNLFDWLLHAQVTIAGSPVLVREIVGNVFGLASALFGMRRLVSAWPVGIIGNVLLFTVFVGGVFDTPQDKDLWGQAGRQVFFALVSLYGWYRWYQARHAVNNDGHGVQPRWATNRERLELLGVAVVLYAISYSVLKALGSWGPQWDASEYRCWCSRSSTRRPPCTSSTGSSACSGSPPGGGSRAGRRSDHRLLLWR